MRYISLNHNSQPVDFKTAVMNGLAPDKGLYFPEEVISLPKKITDNIKSIDSHAIFNIISKQSPFTRHIFSLFIYFINSIKKKFCLISSFWLIQYKFSNYGY